MASVGGYQGRPLRAGDFLRIVDTISNTTVEEFQLAVPSHMIPKYTTDWQIRVMPGPYETGYLTEEDIDAFFSESWTVSHNVARGGIRLIGSRPQFARADGGQGGAHPSNVIEYGYPIGGLNWTGDEPVIFPVDCQDFGGFICSLTIIGGDMWKVGQLRAGETVRFHRVSLEAALDCRRNNKEFIQQLAQSARSGVWDGVKLSVDLVATATETQARGQDVVRTLEAAAGRPEISYRVVADNYLLVDYGIGKSDLNHKCRATALKRALQEGRGPASTNLSQGGCIFNTVGCGNSVAIFHDELRLPQDKLVEHLIQLESTLGDMRSSKFPNRHFRLPIAFGHSKLAEAVERYMVNKRPTASYLPDPLQFLAENNGLTI